MSTDTLVRPDNDTRTDTRPAEPGDHDRLAHYFKKADFEKAMLYGAEIRALCGKWDVPVRDPKKYPLCKTCVEVFGNIPDDPAE